MLSWAAGYTQDELDVAQERFGLRFPPDLVALLRERRIAQGYDWRVDVADIERALDWPREGLIFDVENNALWLEAWGEKPGSEQERAEIVAAAVAAAPKLIPVYGHRYIPETPHAAGNPVFSVYQSDIIIYGETLEAYIAHEFRHPGFVPAESPRHIPFWSDFVEQFGLFSHGRPGNAEPA